MLTLYTKLAMLKDDLRRDEGATAVEYGLMVALIAVVIIAAVIALGDNLAETFQEVADEIGSAGEDGGTDSN